MQYTARVPEHHSPTSSTRPLGAGSGWTARSRPPGFRPIARQLVPLLTQRLLHLELPRGTARRMPAPDAVHTSASIGALAREHAAAVSRLFQGRKQREEGQGRAGDPAGRGGGFDRWGGSTWGGGAPGAPGGGGVRTPGALPKP